MNAERPDFMDFLMDFALLCLLLRGGFAGNEYAEMLFTLFSVIRSLLEIINCIFDRLLSGATHSFRWLLYNNMTNFGFFVFTVWLEWLFPAVMLFVLIQVRTWSWSKEPT